jgi:hypothetical protein
MMHPDTVMAPINLDKGLGVVATKFIPKGTIVYTIDPFDVKIALDSPLLQDSRYREIITRYGYITGPEGYIIGWDHSKYVNHSCSPNTISTGWGFEIAIRDIHPGDEIVDEYGLFNIENDLNCACGAPGCRSVVSSIDHVALTPVWNVWVKEALSQFFIVDQPMLVYLDDEDIKEIKTFVDTKKGYKSVSTNLLPQKLSPPLKTTAQRSAEM